jgi:hypothetical protein
MKYLSLSMCKLWVLVLGNTAVLNSIFEDMQSIVVKVVVNSALADTIVFCWVFNNWLLEITLEMEDLSTSR